MPKPNVIKHDANYHYKIANSLVDKVHHAERTRNQKDAILYGTKFHYHHDMSVKLSGDPFLKKYTPKQIYKESSKLAKTIYSDMSIYKPYK
jgi:hypothetical protein